MPENPKRFVRKQAPPNAAELRDWLGAGAQALWTELTARIETAYPGVFMPDWTNGGQKHGWGLRYKKSKSFCTLVPERETLLVMIVFGAAEREKMEPVLPLIGERLRQAYAAAPTYHDGKWVLCAIETEADLDDLMTCLAVKRRPRPAAS